MKKKKSHCLKTKKNINKSHSNTLMCWKKKKKKSYVRIKGKKSHDKELAAAHESDCIHIQYT